MMARDPTSPLFPYTTLFRSGYLAAGGANALNMYLERDIDAKMKRTRNRPIPSGAVSPRAAPEGIGRLRSEEHTSELQSRGHLVCRLLLEKKNTQARRKQERH